MSRSLLHKSKLPEFKAWLDRAGIAHRPPRGDYARALLLDLRSIFPFEKPLWEPRDLLALQERTLPSVWAVLHHGVRTDTGTARSELVYHSGLPRGSSLSSRREVLP